MNKEDIDIYFGTFGHAEFRIQTKLGIELDNYDKIILASNDEVDIKLDLHKKFSNLKSKKEKQAEKDLFAVFDAYMAYVKSYLLNYNNEVRIEFKKLKDEVNKDTK